MKWYSFKKNKLIEYIYKVFVFKKSGPSMTSFSDSGFFVDEEGNDIINSIMHFCIADPIEIEDQ